MIEVLRSSVNTWECDRMGHLNVRHYFARAHDGLAVLALHCGLLPSELRAKQLGLCAVDQHIRFHREMLPGTSFIVSAGVLRASEHGLHVLEEIRSLEDGALVATIVSEVVLASVHGGELAHLSSDFVARASALTLPLPEYAQARGISQGQPQSRPLLRAEAVRRGLTGAYLGPVVPEDCDPQGNMRESAFMARVSDGIGHFFAQLREGLRPEGVGGAALEYRYAYHQRPRLGDVIEVRSGLKALGNKTLHMCHFIFSLESGACVASSEAVAVSFDLAARKAVPIPDAARTVMQARIIEGLSM
jgi:acyl-CoA thioester hydrolase